MNKRKTAAGILDEIKDLVKKNTLVIGTSVVMKKLKLGKIEKVFLSSNCPADIKKEISDYSKLAKTKVVELKYPNDELGDICKKTFSISVLGVLKETK